jgi:hypothetical protein
MDTKDTVLRVYGLSNADRLDLPDYVGQDNCEFPPPDDSGEVFGEPFTALAIVAATTIAVKGLVAFFAQRSLERQEQETEVEIEVQHPDGRIERRRIKVRDQGAGMAPELAKELGAVSGIPWTELLP